VAGAKNDAVKDRVHRGLANRWLRDAASRQTHEKTRITQNNETPCHIAILKEPPISKEFDRMERATKKHNRRKKDSAFVIFVPLRGKKILYEAGVSREPG
jgi:hypothetical protein